MLKWLRVTLRNLVIFRDFRSNYRKNIPNTIKMITIITAAQVLLVVIKYLNTRMLNRNIACFNQNVREYLMKSNFIEISENNVSKQISFLSNDLNLIEENYFKQLFN